MIAWMQKVARHPALHVVLAVALLAVWLVLESIPGIAALSLHGPDDKLRLVQVRDLLAGQSWFDVSQARIAPPDGGAMHWSRLVDVPLAGTILLAEPALGRAGAERLAVVLVPLLTLLVVAGLTVATARRAAMPSGAKVAKLAGLAALVVFLTWIPATRQMVPLRIDHHGWQTACAALALWALLSPRFVRGAAVAGLATALWLQISIEGLPYAAAIGAVAALPYLAAGEQRLRLPAYLTALAAGSAILFVATRGVSTYFAPYCDAIGPSHLAAFASASASVVALQRFAPVSWQGTAWRRAALIAAAGVPTIAALALVPPGCATAPFASLDPVTREFWYLNVQEGLPVWQLDWTWTSALLATTVLGGAGYLVALRDRPLALASPLATASLLFVAAALIAMLVSRAIAVAVVYALPGIGLLAARMILAARGLTGVLSRVIATAGAALLPHPVVLFAILTLGAMPLAAEPSPTDGVSADAGDGSDRACTTPSNLRSLAPLGEAAVLAPIDIGPALLVATDLRVVATGHHRNDEAIADVITAFLGDGSEARDLARRRGLSAVVLCRGSSEVDLYEERSPDGFYARLARGDAPSWLEAMPLEGAGGDLLAWKIVLVEGDS